MRQPCDIICRISGFFRKRQWTFGYFEIPRGKSSQMRYDKLPRYTKLSTQSVKFLDFSDKDSWQSEIFKNNFRENLRTWDRQTYEIRQTLEIRQTYEMKKLWATTKFLDATSFRGTTLPKYDKFPRYVKLPRCDSWLQKRQLTIENVLEKSQGKSLQISYDKLPRYLKKST